MAHYRIHKGWGGVKVERDTDEEAIAYAKRKYPGNPKVKLIVHKAVDGEWVKVYKS